MILIFFAVLISWFDIRHQIDSKTVILDMEQAASTLESKDAEKIFEHTPLYFEWRCKHDEFHALGLD